MIEKICKSTFQEKYILMVLISRIYVFIFSLNKRGHNTSLRAKLNTPSIGESSNQKYKFAKTYFSLTLMKPVLQN